jgi:glutamine synthetase
VNEHLEKCIQAGLSIYGTNAEVAPSQWEFQIGTVSGIEAAHQLWVARYILLMIAEKYNTCVSFHPKPFSELNGSGCHTNFSTRDTRGPGGYDIMIRDMFPKLEAAHHEHITNYGEFNSLRLTGHHETASISKFSWGVSSRGASIRIGVETKNNKCGYFEDRRPASNCDPYLVSMLLVKTTSV